MAWGNDVNFALQPTVAPSPQWGQMAAELRGREYKKDITTARDEAERKFHNERSQRLAQPLEDHLKQLQESLAELQSQRDKLGAQKLNQDLDAKEANKVEPQTGEEAQMFPSASNGGIGGNRTPDLSGVNPNSISDSQSYKTTTTYQQQEPKEINSYGDGFTNMYDVNDPSIGTPIASTGGNRGTDSSVNTSKAPAGYDQNIAYGQGFGPLANGRLPIEPLVQPQLQLFPKKKTGRYF